MTKLMVELYSLRDCFNSGSPIGLMMHNTITQAINRIEELEKDVVSLRGLVIHPVSEDSHKVRIDTLEEAAQLLEMMYDCTGRTAKAVRSLKNKRWDV